MTERLSNNENVGESYSDWDNLGVDTSFEDNMRKANLDKKADKVLAEESYVGHAKESETYSLGVETSDNAEQLSDLKQKIETSYRMGNVEGAEMQIANQEKLEAEKIRPTGDKLMQDGGEATREQVTDVLARSEHRALEFAKESVTPAEASEIFSQEQTRYNLLMKKYERWNAPGYIEPKGFFERRSHKKVVAETMAELERLGFDPTRRHDSREVEMYGSSFTSGSEKLGLGMSRAEDFKMVSELIGGKYGSKVRKALKKQGFSEIPQNWQDKEFTTHEMSVMSQVAQSAVNTLKYKER